MKKYVLTLLYRPIGETEGNRRKKIVLWASNKKEAVREINKILEIYDDENVDVVKIILNRL